MYQILIREKGNKNAEWKSYMHNLTYEEAVKECEEWGWFYDDGKKSYTMFIQTEPWVKARTIDIKEAIK